MLAGELFKAERRLCYRLMPSSGTYKILGKRCIFYVILKKYKMSEQKIANRANLDVFLS